MTTRSRWLEEGLQILADVGPSGLTIEALCAQLGLSKGSFYHHFGGIKGYRSELLNHFEERETQSFIRLIDSTPSPSGAEGLRRLNKAVLESAKGRRELETAVRAWAGDDPEVREFLERIDQARVEFLQRQCRAVVDDRRTADDVGRTLYLLLIGANHIVPPVSARQQSRLWDRLITLLEHEAARHQQ